MPKVTKSSKGNKARNKDKSKGKKAATSLSKNVTYDSQQDGTSNLENLVRTRSQRAEKERQDASPTKPLLSTNSASGASMSGLAPADGNVRCPWVARPPPVKNPFDCPSSASFAPTLHVLPSMQAFFEWLSDKTLAGLKGSTCLKGNFAGVWNMPWQEHIHLTFYPRHLSTNELFGRGYRFDNEATFAELAGNSALTNSDSDWMIVLYRDTTRAFEGDKWFAVALASSTVPSQQACPPPQSPFCNRSQVQRMPSLPHQTRNGRTIVVYTSNPSMVCGNALDPPHVANHLEVTPHYLSTGPFAPSGITAAQRAASANRNSVCRGGQDVHSEFGWGWENCGSGRFP